MAMCNNLLDCYSMFSVILVLLVIMGCINLISYCHMVNEADNVLDFLAENNGRFPMIGEIFDFDAETDEMSPEMARTSRYFWVKVTENGDVLEVDVSEIAAVNQDTAAQYARQILESGRKRGFVDSYRFLVVDDNDADKGNAENRIQIIFLDCWRSLSNFQTFLFFLPLGFSFRTGGGAVPGIPSFRLDDTPGN